MSIYSTSLKKVVFEPRQFNQSRCEFRLDSGDSMYFNNLRLVNLGAMVATGAGAYNRAAGGYAVIKNLVLLDGSQELERCDETNLYLSWYNKLSKNQDNYYVNQRLVRHGLGYRAEDVEDRVTGNPAISNSLIQDNSNALAQSQNSVWLDLRNCLPLLSAMGALDTRLMPNLRIQIEWDTNPINVSQREDRAITILEPLLLADEIVDDSMKAGLRKGMKDVMWKTYEHDLVIVPAGTIAAANTDNVGVLQQTSRTVNGFDNKYVHRLVAMKTYGDANTAVATGIDGVAALEAAVVQGHGNFISRVQHREKIQFQVNGSNLVVGEGLTSPAMRADMHDQTWGSLNTVPCGIFQSVGLDAPREPVGNALSRGANIVGTNNVSNAIGSSDQVGCDDYIGIRVEERISDLQFKHERSCLNDVRRNKVESTELAIHFYAEIPKQLKLDGMGSYTISYL